MLIKYTTRQEEGTNLLRIIAARDFNGVLKGTLGGLVESEANLTLCGNALVYGTAWVYGDAKVCGNARVSGDAAITPKVLTGFPFTVTFTDDHIRAGCQFHTIEAWCARGAAMIKAEGHPTVTAKAWHSIIMAVSAEHQKDVEQGKLYAK